MSSRKTVISSSAQGSEVTNFFFSFKHVTSGTSAFLAMMHPKGYNQQLGRGWGAGLYWQKPEPETLRAKLKNTNYPHSHSTPRAEDEPYPCMSFCHKARCPAHSPNPWRQCNGAFCFGKLYNLFCYSNLKSPTGIRREVGKKQSPFLSHVASSEAIFRKAVVVFSPVFHSCS